MLRKSSRASNSQTLKKFQEFMKKRLEKKVILQSQNQSIDRKVVCFEELLKLTKTGDTLVHHNQRDQSHLTSKASKVSEKRRDDGLENEENTDLVAGRLDKMVHDINGWMFSKKISERNSPDQKKYKLEREYNLTHAERKVRKVQHKSTKVSRVKYGSNFTEVFTEEAQEAGEDGKKYYAAMPKRSQYKFLKNSNKQTSKTINCVRKGPDFTSLRQEIAIFQHRAKEIYGLSFEKQAQKKEIQQFDECCPSRDQNKEMMRVISSNQLKKAGENAYRQLVEEHTREDSSVPATFLGVIRSNSAKTRKGMNGTSASHFIRI